MFAARFTWHFIEIFIPLNFLSLSDSLGRRRSMMLVNVPYFCAWFMLCQANSIHEIFIGFVMLGLAVGLMEAPVVTYLGEIW